MNSNWVYVYVVPRMKQSRSLTPPYTLLCTGGAATYCTAYHRLVTGDQEIFCDDLHYQVRPAHIAQWSKSGVEVT